MIVCISAKLKERAGDYVDSGQTFGWFFKEKPENNFLAMFVIPMAGDHAITTSFIRCIWTKTKAAGTF